MSDSLIHVIHQLEAIIIFNTYYLPLLWFRMIILEVTRFLTHPAAKERAPQLGEEREDEESAVYTFQPTIADTNLGNCVFVDLLIILYLYLMRGGSLHVRHNTWSSSLPNSQRISTQQK